MGGNPATHGLVAAAMLLAGCQLLLDLPNEANDAGLGDPDANGPVDASSTLQDAVADRGGLGANRGSAYVLRSIGQTASGLAARQTVLAWVESPSLMMVDKGAPLAPPTSIEEPCSDVLFGPVAGRSAVYTACGHAGGANVVVYTVAIGSTTPVPKVLSQYASQIQSMAAAGSMSGVVMSTTATSTWCAVVLDQTTIGVPCTPGPAAANESAFFFADGAGGIGRLDWGGASPGAPWPVPGKVLALAASDDALFWASTAGVGTTSLTDSVARLLLDGGGPSAVAIAGPSLAVIRSGKVLELPITGGDTIELSPPAAEAELLAADADGVYWKQGTELWVAPTCPGSLCQKR